MGARPIYYIRNNRFFAFASQEEALSGLLDERARPNEELIAYFLYPEFKTFNTNQAWLQDVWAVPAASSITVFPNSQVKEETYWALQPQEENTFTSAEECQQAFLDVFGEAVRCRMRSSGTVSAMMSGGLDSASIMAMVKRLQPELHGQEFHTFSAISDAPESCVETQCIQSLTRNLGNNAHFVSVPSFSGMLNIQDLVDAGWSKAHPVDNSMLLSLLMILAAKRAGHRVMLHGMGGDLTTYVPNYYIAALLKAGKFNDAWKACRATNRNHTYLRETPPLRLLLSNSLLAFTPSSLKQFVRSLRGRAAHTPWTETLINPAFADRLHLDNRLRRARQPADLSIAGMQQSHIQILSPPHGITSGLSGYNRLSGRYGLELRDPWSDLRVVNFFLRLPLKYKIRDGWTKHLVRTSFAADLGPQISRRNTKEHLGWQIVFRLLEETQDLVLHAMEEQLDVAEQYINVDAARSLNAKTDNRKSFDERMNVYDIMTLILWLQRINV